MDFKALNCISERATLGKNKLSIFRNNLEPYERNPITNFDFEPYTK